MRPSICVPLFPSMIYFSWKRTFRYGRGDILRKYFPGVGKNLFIYFKCLIEQSWMSGVFEYSCGTRNKTRRYGKYVGWFPGGFSNIYSVSDNTHDLWGAIETLHGNQMISSSIRHDWLAGWLAGCSVWKMIHTCSQLVNPVTAVYMKPGKIAGACTRTTVSETVDI